MIISLDTEYSEKDIKKAELLSISIGISDSKALLFKPRELQSVQKLIDQAELIFVQNGVVDWFMLTKNNLKIPKDKFLDCMLMEHLIDETIPHNLNEMSKRYFNDPYKEVFWSKYDRFQDASPQDAAEYERKDAIYTFRLGLMFYDKLFNKLELVQHVHRLQWSLFDTEISGIRVNTELMKKTKIDMHSQISEYLPTLRGEFNEHCQYWEVSEWAKRIEKRSSAKGKDRVPRPVFSFSSEPQLKWLIFDAMGLPISSRTKTGAPKTDYDTIKELSAKYPPLKMLADYKEIKSVYSTFVEGLLDRVNEGRIYPHFNVNGTKNAGRISHSDPNMGNMPKEGVIRNFFIPDPGHAIVGADYSQLEVVVEANLTNDSSLLKIINEGVSKHDITAQGLGISRDQAKTLNFALQYGASVFKVSKVLSVSMGSAQDIYNRYWRLYSGVSDLKASVAKGIEEKGYIETQFGRRRHFPKPTNKFEKAKFERQAYNALIQGTGADCTNRATYLIYENLKQTGLGNLWFSVHDEIVVQIKQDYAETYKQIIIDTMEGVTEYARFRYPLKATSYGPLEYWQKA